MKNILVVLLFAVMIVGSQAAYVLNAGALNADHAKTSEWAKDHRLLLMGFDITDGTSPKGLITREEQWTMMGRYNAMLASKLNNDANYDYGKTKKLQGEVRALKMREAKQNKRVKQLERAQADAYRDLNNDVQENRDSNDRMRDDMQEQIDKERTIIQSIESGETSANVIVVNTTVEKNNNPFYLFAETQSLTEDNELQAYLLEGGFTFDLWITKINPYIATKGYQDECHNEGIYGVRVGVNAEKRLK